MGKHEGLSLHAWGEDPQQPLASRGAGTVADTVFVHGLGGDRKTWGEGKKNSLFWPSWLAAERPEGQVWVLEYDSKFIERQEGGDAHPIDRASSLLDRLYTEGIGQRPLMWVAHSLGGLLVKEIMRLAADSGSPRYGPLLTNTRAAVFIATPHTGSSLANLADFLHRAFGLAPDFLGIFLGWLSAPSTSVGALKKDNPWIRNLTAWYRSQAVQRQILTAAYFEGHPWKGRTVVGEGSSDPGVPGCVPVFVDADHIGIAKPGEKESPVYAGVAKIFEEFLDGVQLGKKKPVFPGAHAVKRMEEWDTGVRTANMKAILRTVESQFTEGTLGTPSPEQEHLAEKSEWDLDALILYTLNRLRYEEASRRAFDHVRYEYLRLRGEVSKALSAQEPRVPSLTRLYYALEAYSALAEPGREKLLREISSAITGWASQEVMTKMDEGSKTRNLIEDLLP